VTDSRKVAHTLTSCLYTSMVWTSLAVRRSVGKKATRVPMSQSQPPSLPCPPTSYPLTPKTHSPILATRQHLRAPFPQCQTMDVVSVAPEGPLQGKGKD
jgi:hypothetical protein